MQKKARPESARDKAAHQVLRVPDQESRLRQNNDDIGFCRGIRTLPDTRSRELECGGQALTWASFASNSPGRLSLTESAGPGLRREEDWRASSEQGCSGRFCRSGRGHPRRRQSGQAGRRMAGSFEVAWEVSFTDVSTRCLREGSSRDALRRFGPKAKEKPRPDCSGNAARALQAPMQGSVFYEISLVSFYK